MTTEVEGNSKWDMLQSFPFTYLTQAFVINNDEFIIASKKIYNNNYSGDGIYKFNIHKNKWIRIFDYDSDLQCTIASAAYDNKHKLLYCCDYPSTMLIFDLKTKSKVTTIAQQDKMYFRLIFVESKLHQICNVVPIIHSSPVQGGDHYMYDTTKQFNKITRFDSFKYLVNNDLIYLKSQKYIFSLGGLKRLNHQNSIYRFSFTDSKWEELNIKMPTALSSCGLVA
eukprot:496582_1